MDVDTNFLVGQNRYLRLHVRVFEDTSGVVESSAHHRINSVVAMCRVVLSDVEDSCCQACASHFESI